MPKPLKIILNLFLGVLLLFLLLIVGIVLQTHRSKRQVEDIVKQMKPGEPFTVVLEKLGHPVYAITNAVDIGRMGSRQDEPFVTDTVLYKFGHRGPPYRWILIYTDRESLRVVYADWTNM